MDPRAVRHAVPGRSDPTRGMHSAGTGMHALGVLQHALAAALVALGVIRALTQDAEPVLAVGMGVVLAAVYATGVWRTHDVASARRWLLILAGVWAATVFISPEFVWVGFLLWLLGGFVLPLASAALFAAVVYAVVIVAPLYAGEPLSYAGVFGPAVGAVVAVGLAWGYLQLLRVAEERTRLAASLSSAYDELADLQDELAHTQRASGAAAERTRIARDIHDTVAQSLSSIALVAHAGVARTDQAVQSKTLRQIEGLAKESLVDVRRIVAALAPSDLEEQALATALRRVLDKASATSGLDVDLQVDDALPQLGTAAEVALLRGAQSALANVQQHAKASRVAVALSFSGDQVRLDVVDDGCGFDVAAWQSQRHDESSSYGLRLLQNRFRELGGGVDVESDPSGGTAISLHVPTGPHVRGRS